ncbi:MAG: type II toxin-antitoxin system RelE/ParE family toxin [Bacteroidota bacterium]
MKFQIVIKRKALKEIERLPKQYISKVRETIDQLEENPYPNGHRKLVGSLNDYRIRVGDYRIIYSVFEKELLVEVIRVRHRKDVYK